MDDKGTLRERKQRRTRDAIVAAALELFAERGFDGVTVTDIAARAEVGRSTFFRYFTDKQEVLFHDDGEMLGLMVEAIGREAARRAPLGGSLAAALAAGRAGLLALTDYLRDYSGWLEVRVRLIESHPDLRARTLVKEQGFVTAGAAELARHGADPSIAALAAGFGLACFGVAQARALDSGQPLGDAVEEVFRQLSTLDAAALRSYLDG
jgi:AcrR family transcriptional regulator